MYLNQWNKLIKSVSKNLRKIMRIYTLLSLFRIRTVLGGQLVRMERKPVGARYCSYPE